MAGFLPFHALRWNSGRENLDRRTRRNGKRMPPVKVLFLCTGNSCRSQMAEGLLRHLGKDAVEVASAGTEPKPVHPDAGRSMQEMGIDISGQRSKPLEPYLGQSFDYCITLCEDARQQCPRFPGAVQNLHWSIPDPATAQGTAEQRQEVFRQVRKGLKERIHKLLAEIRGPAEDPSKGC